MELPLGLSAGSRVIQAPVPLPPQQCTQSPSSTVRSSLASCFCRRLLPHLARKQKLVSTCAHQGLQPNQHLYILEVADQNLHSTMCNWWFPLDIGELS